MTFKERIAQAISTLGQAKSNSIVAAIKLGNGQKYPTQKQKMEALERELRNPAQSTAAKPASPATIVPNPAPSPSLSPADLCNRYDALATHEQRRDFFKLHQDAISKARLNGLVIGCMLSARPFSVRARAHLPAGAQQKQLTLTPGEFRALDGYTRGVFLSRGGKIVSPIVSREILQALSPRDRAEFIRDGGKLTDD